MLNKFVVSGIIFFICLAAFLGRSWLFEDNDFLVLDSGPFRAVYLIPDAEAELDNLEVIVQAGEIDNDGPEGLAHYVEHLAWLDQLNVGDSKTSRHSNAWTSMFATGYTTSGPTDDLAKNLKRLVTTSEPNTLRPDFITQERGIVRREYDQRVGESTDHPIWREMDKKLLSGSPLARTVLGTPESIAQFNGEIAFDLHAKTHTLSNMVLIAYGRMSADDLSAEIAKLGRVDPVPIAAVPASPSSALRDEADIHVPDLTAEALFYQKIADLPDGEIDLDTVVAIWVLENIIDSGLPGGIAGPLRFENFITQSFGVSVREQPPNGVRLSFKARPDVGVSLDEVQAAFEAAIAVTQTQGISDETFQAIKTQRLDDLENTKDRAEFTRHELRANVIMRRQAVGYSATLQALKDLQLEDVTAILDALSDGGRTVIRRASPTPKS